MTTYIDSIITATYIYIYFFFIKKELEINSGNIQVQFIEKTAIHMQIQLLPLTKIYMYNITQTSI